jgi:hypothetical protein
MKTIFLISVFSLGLVFGIQAQQTAKDSITQIESERLELSRMQDRIRAKQDSLVRERLKIEQEHKKAEEARRVEQNKQATSVQTTVPIVIKKRKIKNIVGLAPAHMFITGIDVFYERAIGKKTSLVISGGYHGMENYPNNNPSSSNSSSSNANIGNAFLSGDKVAYYGMRLQLQLRAYLFEEADALEKLYIAPTFLYKQDELVQLHDHTYLTTGSSPQYDNYFAEAVVPGLDIGYQLRLLRYFSVNPYIGFMYTVPITAKDQANMVNIDFLNPYRQNLMLRTGLTIGFTF